MLERPYKVLGRCNTLAWEKERGRWLTASVSPGVLDPSLRWRGKPKTHPGSRVWWGSRDERGNQAAFSELTGVRAQAAPWFLASTKYAGLATSLDAVGLRPELCDMWHRQVVQSGADVGAFERRLARLEKLEDRRLLIELKLTGHEYADDWLDSPRGPKRYWAQLQHELLVTGYPAGVLVARCGAYDMFCHAIVFPTPKWQARLIRAGEVFARRLAQQEAEKMAKRGKR